MSIKSILVPALRAIALALSLLPTLAFGTATINLSFTPATINPGDPSQLAVSIFNSGVNSLSAAAVTINLATGVTIGATPVTNDTCGFGSVSAPANGTVIKLSGGSVPAAVPGGADGSCTFTININSTTPGNLGTTIPANGPSNGFTPGGTVSGFSADDAGSIITNATAATATLAVNAISAPTGAITYAPTSVLVGEVTRMSITLTNNNASVTLPLTSFTDTLPAGLSIAATPTPAITCAGGTTGTLSTPSVGGAVTPGDASITLTGGTIAGGGTCVIAVNVVAGLATGTQTNTVAANAIGNSRGLTSASFTRNITVSTPVAVAQSFSGGATVRAGQASTLTLTITNNSTGNLLDITSFTDNLAAGLLITASPVPAISCSGTGGVNGTLTATAGTTVITLTGATAAKGGTCVITVGVAETAAGTLASTSATTVVAGTQMTNAAVTPGNLSVPASTANLTSAAQFTLAKSASTGASAYQGQAITYTVTLSNWSPGAASNVSFTDTLPSVGGVPMTLSAGSALGAGCSGGTFSAAAGATAVTWTGGTVASGVGTAAGTCVITIVTAMPAGSTVGDAYVNSLPINTSVTGTDINSTSIKNTNAASVTTNATASVTVSQNFAPNTIYQGASTVLTVTITNPTASALTGTAFSETFNAAVTVAAVPLTSSTCTGTPVITAVPGAGSFSASGLTVPAGGNCNVKVSVTASTVGAFANSVAIGAISNDQGLSNTSAANRTLTVNSPITAVAAFSPASAGVGGSSRLTLTVTNNGATALSNVAITAPMQTGANAFVVSSTPGASSTCAGSTAITANAGATSASMTGASLAAGANCTLAFNITTVTGGNWSFSMPAGNITSTEGAINTTAVTTTLTKATVVMGVNKSFAPNSINGGTASVLQVDITNPLGAASAANGVAFTDTFPTGMEVYATPNASTTCTNGVVSAVPGDNKISLASADIAVGSTCSVLVNVTSVKPLNLTNTIAIGALSSQQGFTNTLATSASLSTLQGLGVIKSFSPIAIAPGQVSHLAIKLISTLNTTTLNNVSVTDTLPSGVVVAPTPNVSSTCDAAPSPAAGASSIVISGISIAAQTNCTVQVDVTAATPGTYTNTIAMGGATSTEGYANQTATTAVLNVMNAPTVALAYGAASVQAGTATTLTMTLGNTNATALTASALNVSLPAGLSVDLTPGTNTTCGGSVVATAAGSSIALSGATIPASGSCTFRANVSSNTPASYVASVPSGAISTAQGVSNTASASATLIVLQFPSVSQSLSVSSIAPGGTTRLTITLGNSNASAITMSSVFTDTLPVAPGNLLIVNPNGLTTTCTLAKVTATAGSGAISYSATASTIPAGGCTIAVNLTASALGTYTNTIPAGALQTTAGNSQAASSTTLTVSNNTPPTASSFSAAVNNNAVTAITIGPMVGTPQGGATISTYTVTALPANATLYCSAVAMASVPSNCAANALSVKPVGAPTGTSTFTYTVTDSNSLTSSAATATITWNTPPTAAAVNNAAISSAAVTAQALSTLSGTATTAGATITTYTVATLPAAGTLYCSAVAIASVPSNCAANALSFRPLGSAVNPETFTYTVTDSNAMTSAAATVSIPLNVGPTASNFSAAVNNNAVTAITIGPMVGTPQGGTTISTYTVTALPANATLYCSAVAMASVPSNCAANALSVKPVDAPTGTSTFTYTVTDSNSLTSSAATATITWNTPPTANAVNASLDSTQAGPYALASLSGSVTSSGTTLSFYTVTSIPPASAGVLSCSGVGITSPPVTCAPGALSFAPAPGASGATTFQYTVTDANGMVSTPATATLTLLTVPIATAINAGPLDAAISTPQALPSLAGTVTTPGATLTTYTITTLPTASSGTLYCNGVAVTAVPATCAPHGLALRVPPGASGPAVFNYTVTDSNHLVSAPVAVTIALQASPALTLRKTSNGAMTIGFDATYTLQVSNRSTTTATNAAVTVTDTLPAGLDFISAAGVNAPSNWTCNWTASTRVIACTSTAVIAASGNAEAIALRVKPNAAAVTSGATSPIINSAVVAGGGETPSYANGTAPGAQPHTSTDTQTVQAPASISGSSWVDSNHNGVRDSGEPTPPTGSVRVEIWPAGTTAAQAASGTPITSATLESNGSYQVNVPPGNLMVRFVDVSTGASIGSPVNGETPASRNQPGVTSSSGVSIAGAIDNISVTPGAVITQQSLPIDPQGVVYDAGTRLPIGGATVTLVARGQPVPTACLAGGPNPYVTSPTGSFAGGYQFLLDFTPAGCAALSGATFNLQVSAAGYRSPSALIPPGLRGQTVLTTPTGSGLYAVVPKVGVPAAGDPTTYYLALVLGSASMGVVNNNIPLDGSAPAAVVITKTASRSTAEIGDAVRYTITVRNAGQAVLPALTLTDRLPLGFKLIDKTATVTSGATSSAIATVSLGPVIDFVIPGLRPGATETLQYLVRIGIGGDKGDGTNHVRASVGSLMSNEATATVKVTGGVFGTDACLAGKVFMDCDGDGVQGAGEPGVAGVRLWLETGVSIITDAQGKFSVCGLAPRTHAIKIDPATLPPGTTPLITSNRNLGDAGSLLLDAKQGELIRADFALGQCATPPKPEARGRTPDKDASPRLMFEGTASHAARAQGASHE